MTDDSVVFRIEEDDDGPLTLPSGCGQITRTIALGEAQVAADPDAWVREAGKSCRIDLGVYGLLPTRSLTYQLDEGYEATTSKSDMLADFVGVWHEATQALPETLSWTRMSELIELEFTRARGCTGPAVLATTSAT